VNLLHRPDKIESRDAFYAYVGAMLRSLDQALANPSDPYGPAVDDQGVEWENTTLSMFAEAMHAWMVDQGWTSHDRRESLVWAALGALPEEPTGDEEDLRGYLERLLGWASDETLDEDQHWRPAAQALAAGRSYE
jgi:hypothetical protein